MLPGSGALCPFELNRYLIAGFGSPTLSSPPVLQGYQSLGTKEEYAEYISLLLETIVGWSPIVVPEP